MDGDQYETMTEAELKNFSSSHVWKYAKSMPKIPHDYVLLWTASSQHEFFRFVMTVRRHGYDEKFRTMKIRYLEFGENKFWTMGEFLETTWVLNRARIHRPPRPWSSSVMPFKPRKGRKPTWQKSSTI